MANGINTVVVITSDHAEQLGDQGLVQKCGDSESSYHILCIVRDPAGIAGAVVDEFTDAATAPTICDAIGLPVPTQCDGLPLTPFLRGRVATSLAHGRGLRVGLARDAFIMMDSGRGHAWPWQRSLERRNLAVVRTDTHADAQFGDGDWTPSTSSPTPAGRSPSPIPPSCCPWPNGCWCGANSTSTAPSPAC